jgi:REP element-mobilizing transposase RayT
VAHARRERFAARFPQHVTLRVRAEVGSVRRYRVMRVVRAALLAGGHRADFRVVEFSVQSNHVHLLVEAEGATSLTRGMIGLEVRLARRINRALGRSGAFFADRYHARSLRTPAEARAAIRYVLFNNRHHARSGRARDALVTRAQRTLALDPCSSAPWFDGWTAARPPEPWERELLDRGRPHARATVWLLTTGWKRHGLMGRDELPGPRSRFLA